MDTRTCWKCQSLTIYFEMQLNLLILRAEKGGDAIYKIEDTIINKCINYFCREDQYVIDLFTKGIVSMHAIRQLRRVVTLVTTNQEAIEIESKCVHIA